MKQSDLHSLAPIRYNIIICVINIDETIEVLNYLITQYISIRIVNGLAV